MCGLLGKNSLFSLSLACRRVSATKTLVFALLCTFICRRQLVLVDRGILRPGDAFVSGMLWGFVRSIYDEEGDKLLEHAGTCLHRMCTITWIETDPPAPSSSFAHPLCGISYPACWDSSTSAIATGLCGIDSRKTCAARRNGARQFLNDGRKHNE